MRREPRLVASGRRVAVARLWRKRPKRRFDSCWSSSDALKDPRTRQVTEVPRVKHREFGCGVGRRFASFKRTVAPQSRGPGNALLVEIGGRRAEVFCDLRVVVATLHSA